MLNTDNEQPFDCSGCSTKGIYYDSINEMWESELASEPHSEKHPPTHQNDQPDNYPTPQVPLNPQRTGVKRPRCDPHPSQQWYSKSANYWLQQDPSVDGMLGGLGKLDTRDITASRKFLDSLRRRIPTCGSARALDVGAGIGRVTKHLLLHQFDAVDMLEQNPNYLQESFTFIGETSYKGVVDKRLPCGMQSFHPRGVLQLDGLDSGSLRNRYNLIWIQWCIIYLTDDDFVTFLRHCTQCLLPGGLICLKDNVVRSGFVIDNDDSSIMRSDKYLKHIFARADLEVIRETVQLDFPRDIFPVRTYALRPYLETAQIDQVVDKQGNNSFQKESAS